MARSYNIHETDRKTLPRFILLIALCVVLILGLFIATIALTLRQTDRLIRRDPEPLTTFAKHVLSPYTSIAFTSFDGQTELEGWFFGSAS